MKTINSGKKTLEIFNDPQTGEYIGFAGDVTLYNVSVYMNTKTGEGYGEVIKQLNKFVVYLSSRYRLEGFSFEDIKQHIIVHILECLPKYDPRRNTKLSTFIQTCVSRRLINEIRNQGRLYHNATVLNICSYNIECPNCGACFTLTANIDDNIEDFVCDACHKQFGQTKLTRVSKPELSLESVFDSKQRADENVSCKCGCSSDMEMSTIYDVQKPLDEDVINKCDIEALLEDLRIKDPCTAKLIELHCFKDYSVHDAAKEVGISGMGARNKLKDLRRKLKVRKIFDR
jgi:RNA polymerase sigma factor (sigma-70 family)